MRSISFAEKKHKAACLIASLSTQDMALWDFFPGKELPVTEEKVSNSP